jgi:ABC-type amino acid transport substrate-binding protein
MRRRSLACLWLALAAAWPSLAPAAPTSMPVQTIVYPRSETLVDQRDDYPIELLALALRKSNKPYELTPHPVFMLQVRQIAELEQGRDLDVMWTMTSVDREKALLPIRIPIDRGLLGWRLLLVRSQSLPKFAALSSPDQLKQLRAGQGFDWPDTAILKHAGFDVDESVRYGDLFLKLAGGRIDYFPRSVWEIWSELAVHGDAGFAVEPSMALHYPTATYFFVNRNNTALAADIKRGLEAAMADGSFEALFQRHFGAALKRAALDKRLVLELANPLLPPETPLANQRLWYQPGR